MDQIPDDLLQLAAMLDEPDENIATNILAQLVAREDELGDLQGILQESPSPIVRKRAHMLQNAIAMRQRRRRIYRILNGDEKCDILRTLTEIHLLWFDRDQFDDIWHDVQKFLDDASRFPMETLEDAEFFMRKKLFLPENETTTRPESLCIGTVLYHHSGAASLLMAVLLALLDNSRFKAVRIFGEFGIMDTVSHEMLLGNSSWRMTVHPSPENAETWEAATILKYICTTLLSCAVNSDSYRYVMSITQALTGDESEHVFDAFPYPFFSGEQS